VRSVCARDAKENAAEEIPGTRVVGRFGQEDVDHLNRLSESALAGEMLGDFSGDEPVADFARPAVMLG
jgi:hypothetical protein